ncbi:hypothetical protein P7K49_019150 [Saguinus oedipus]|uniref:Uncharacterized protein n=1 Tax=Saguinus oedipus TaxID=9490 RepID=A0ABQ9UXI4_SAGOE|nr:hypothetical protein P7K49_019150 [Saguinus oedipus]
MTSALATPTAASLEAITGRRASESRTPALTLSSCPDAIKEVFDSKFHIIGAVGIGIAVVMVSGETSSQEGD